MKYFICLSYNGSPFCGWQIQKNAESIQEELQKAFSLLLKEEIEITGAGRTDSGVNAIDYIAHTEIHSKIGLKGKSKDDFLYKLNAILPKAIHVHDIMQVHQEAHARFDAVSRTYKYFIHLAPDPFNSAFSYFYKPGNLDFEAMNRAAEYFIGCHDFTSLEKAGSDNKTSVCTVTEAFWAPVPQASPFDLIDNGSHYAFTVSADRFLRNMVRAMVGSLLEVGSLKRPPEWIGQMLQQKNRCSAGASVPGNALFLTNIRYPYDIYGTESTNRTTTDKRRKSSGNT